MMPWPSWHVIKKGTEIYKSLPDYLRSFADAQTGSSMQQHPVGELMDVDPQKEFRYTSDGKPIRLDIYSRDEVQRTDDTINFVLYKKQ